MSSETVKSVKRWYWQRLSAVLMLVFILVHLSVIFIAASRGFSAADIFSRTQGSVAWAAFYGIFVVLVTIHAPIGLRSVLIESRINTVWSVWLSRLFAVVLLVLGLRAVWALTFGVGA